MAAVFLISFCYRSHFSFTIDESSPTVDGSSPIMDELGTTAHNSWGTADFGHKKT
jgi:hypothetical protein